MNKRGVGRGKKGEVRKKKLGRCKRCSEQEVRGRSDKENNRYEVTKFGAARGGKRCRKRRGRERYCLGRTKTAIQSRLTSHAPKGHHKDASVRPWVASLSMFTDKLSKGHH
jgi:hypothetical protein